MSGKDSKSIIQRAKLDLDSIVNLAKENILKEHEEKIQKMIEEAMDEIEMEDSSEEDPKVETISEMIKLETDDMKIVVDDDGSTKVEHKVDEEAAAAEEKTSAPVDAVTQQPVDTAATTTVVDATPEPVAVDAVGDDEQIELSSDEDEIQIANEVEQTPQPMNQEQAPAAPEAAPTAQATPAAPETAPEAAPEAAPAEDLAGELASVISKMIAQQTGGSVDGGAEGDEVSIVDDETEAGAVAPAAPEAAPAPAMEEMIELDEDDDLIEIEFEEEEEVMDEVKAMGVSHALNRTAGPHTAPEVAVKNRTRSGAKMNENTEKENAQYEAMIAELKNENKSLKGQIGEFRNAFIELREHYDEMQTFNQKLALAHRVIIQGGWTEKEKARISERFEAAKDAEDAKRIYKEIMSERSLPKNNDVIKSSAIPVVQSKKQPIYESEAAKRARVLAGIDTPNED